MEPKYAKALRSNRRRGRGIKFLMSACLISVLQSVSAGTLISGVLSGTAHAEPIGLWRASDGGLTRISPCGTALCGYIVSVNPKIDPSTGQPATDKNNPDPSKQNRPLIGIRILIGMQPDGVGRWSGELYDTDRGQVFPGHLIQLDANTVRVEGCALGICGGEDMSRVKSKIQ
jgi:uncharacterized protein (DUF2147 family)